ncbi:MAG TPA: DNA polymerase III subunit gamma/tau [Candidatus Anaerotignum merdipullorum]|nr:DNA polymerase III subunit gamma/tau [Candidatus Anaerotignum merdipullorum]
MSYTALYRKYRPNVFSGVVGQDPIVKTLKNQMKTGRVSHAYLFCGTRGTGKTSTAKIFARAINCLHPTAEGEPCNQCRLCQEILAGRSVNVMEIDAASNNSVDNIREIREEVKYPPTEGVYKVYIIDEVHMLSNSAFNALLKTLEEPPAHVVFILATTDPQKVPPTILSRCQRFDFRRITAEDIAHTLMRYLAEEGLSATEDAVRYVAQLADGSLRDSLSILDQCLAFYSGEEVTLEKVQDVVGAVDQTVFFDMVDALKEKDAARAMALTEEMLLAGRDVKQFVTDLLVHLRNLLVTATVSEATRILDLSAEHIQRLRQQAAALSAAELTYWMERFSALQSDIRYAAKERILLEVEILRLCSDWADTDLTALAARLAMLERKVSEGVSISAAQVAMTQEASVGQKEKPKRKPPALSEEKEKLRQEWQAFCSRIADPVLRSKLSNVEIGFKEDDAVYLVCPYGALADMLQKYLDTIAAELEQAYGKSFTLQTIEKAAYESWREANYGSIEADGAGDDSEWTSIMSEYFPEAEMEP